MASGSVRAVGDLPERVHTLFERERRGVMTTLDPDGRGHSVPIGFVLIGDEIMSPIDHKPKSGRKLRRLSNIERDDRVTLLVDHWDEDWTRLSWVMVRAQAEVVAEAAPEVATTLNTRYPQYAPDELPDAWIRMRPTRLTWWSWD